MFNSIDEGVSTIEIIFDENEKAVDFRFLESNPAMTKATGLTNEIHGKTAKEVLPNIEEFWLETYGRVVKTGESIRFEYTSEDLDANWFEVHAYKVGDKQSRKIITVYNKITDRKNEEEKQTYILKLSDAIKELIDPVDIQLTACRILGEHVSASRVLYAEVINEEQIITNNNYVNGVPPINATLDAEQFGRNVIDAFKRSEKVIISDITTDPRYTEEAKQSFLSLDVVANVGMGLVKGGRWVAALGMHFNAPREWTATEILLMEETAERTWAAVERAKAEQALRKSEEKYRTLFTSIDQGFVLCELVRNKEGKGIDYYMLELNPTYEKQTGLSIEMVLGKTILQVFPTMNERHIDTYAAVVDNQRPAVFEYYLEFNNRWFEVKAYPDEKDKFAVLFSDITGRKMFEKELIEAKISAENAVKSKQQFLSNMSHEIRTPLNSILGFANVLLKTELGVEQKEYLQAIKTSSKSLNLLIDDILDLAKVDAGKMTFQKQPFEIYKSVTSILHSFDLKIKEKNLKLIKEYDSKIPTMLLGDSLRLNQIFLNLLSNSVKFTHKGKITLGIKLLSETKENVTLEFAVTDTGIGIADNKLNSIFNLFEQAELSTSNSYGGTGLGLAIVKQLIEAQGGSVSVKSKFGEGSTFSFILPFGKTNVKSEEENEIVKSDTEIKNVRVLVAEDVALNQLLIKIILTDFGFEYEIVNNGKLAIERLQTHTYDIVLMDLQMPEMNGFKASEYIRKTLKSQIPIIALTADVTTADVSKCRQFGMDDYISKPINEDLLYSKIMELVKKKL